MSDDTIIRHARLDADREGRTKVPSYPAPGVVPGMVAIYDRQVAELEKLTKQLARLRARLDRIKHATNGTHKAPRGRR